MKSTRQNSLEEGSEFQGETTGQIFDLFESKVHAADFNAYGVYKSLVIISPMRCNYYLGRA